MDEADDLPRDIPGASEPETEDQRRVLEATGLRLGAEQAAVLTGHPDYAGRLPPVEDGPSVLVQAPEANRDEAVAIAAKVLEKHQGKTVKVEYADGKSVQVREKREESVLVGPQGNPLPRSSRRPANRAQRRAARSKKRRER